MLLWVLLIAAVHTQPTRPARVEQSFMRWHDRDTGCLLSAVGHVYMVLNGSVPRNRQHKGCKQASIEELAYLRQQHSIHAHNTAWQIAWVLEIRGIAGLQTCSRVRSGPSHRTRSTWTQEREPRLQPAHQPTRAIFEGPDILKTATLSTDAWTLFHLRGGEKNATKHIPATFTFLDTVPNLHLTKDFLTCALLCSAGTRGCAEVRDLTATSQ